MQRRKYALLKQPFELDALGDVTLTNPVLGDIMYYDGSFWINTPYAELVDDRVAALLVAGNNIDITYNDGAGTITIDVETLTSADISDFNEAVDDRVSSLIVAGNNIDVTYNDGANTFTIDVEGLTSADISDFTEAAQDAVGAMVSTSGTGVDLVYTDATPALAANLDINGLTEDTTPDTAADYLATYDASAGTHKKVLLDNLGLTGGGGGAVSPVNDGCVVERNTDISVTATVWAAIDFITEVRDDNGYWSSGDGNAFVVPQAGYYVVHAHTEWGSGTGFDRGIFLFKGLSRGQQIAGNYKAAASGERTDLSWTGYLAAGDVLEFWAYSGNTSTISGTAATMRASIHRLGTPNITKSPDSYPSSSNTLNDEFEASALDAKWVRDTNFSTGTAPTVTLADGAAIFKSNSAAGPHCYSQSVSGTFKIRAKCAMVSAGGLSSGYTSSQQVGIYVSYSTTKRISWHILSTGSLEVGRWNGTSFSTANSYSVGATKEQLEQGIYLEIEVDATTVYFRASRTGHDGTFFTLASESIASFLGTTPDKCGLMIHPSSATDVWLVCDWFRRIS